VAATNEYPGSATYPGSTAYPGVYGGGFVAPVPTVLREMVLGSGAEPAPPYPTFLYRHPRYR
jgi:hypothetical protein